MKVVEIVANENGCSTGCDNAFFMSICCVIKKNSQIVLSDQLGGKEYFQLVRCNIQENIAEVTYIKRNNQQIIARRYVKISADDLTGGTRMTWQNTKTPLTTEGNHLVTCFTNYPSAGYL